MSGKTGKESAGEEEGARGQGPGGRGKMRREKHHIQYQAYPMAEHADPRTGTERS